LARILEVAEVELCYVASAELLTKFWQAASSTACCVVDAIGETWECGCSPWSTDHEVCNLSNIWQRWITQLVHTPGDKQKFCKTSGFNGGCWSDDGLLGFYTILHISCSGDSEACAALIFRVTKFGSGGCCSYPEDEGSTFLQNVGTNPLCDTV